MFMINTGFHDLREFMRSTSQYMSGEYERIRKRASEDPGTAGDQGEENWAELLRGWLPPTYQVVTKGRILNHEGRTSPQVDVLVLHPTYPKKLLNVKHYLAAGVAAAFECKITLRNADVIEAVKKSSAIKRLYPVRTGTPYKELNTPVRYGLLAHSHNLSSAQRTPTLSINDALNRAEVDLIKHPREMLDLICIADLASWFAFKFTHPPTFTLDPKDDPTIKSDGANSYYLDFTYTFHSCMASKAVSGGPQLPGFTPIGAMLCYLLNSLAWEDTALRELARYFFMATPLGYGEGMSQMRPWENDLFSDGVREQLANSLSGGPWDEWRCVFPV